MGAIVFGKNSREVIGNLNRGGFVSHEGRAQAHQDQQPNAVAQNEPSDYCPHPPSSSQDFTLTGQYVPNLNT